MGGGEEDVAVVELSIPETNALRAKLGLKPLRIGPLSKAVGGESAPAEAAGGVKGVEVGVGKSSSDEISLSIDETNALRIELGLAPLRVSSLKDVAPGRKPSEAIHAPPSNRGEDDAARRRIEDAKARREVEEGVERFARQAGDGGGRRVCGGGGGGGSRDRASDAETAENRHDEGGMGGDTLLDWAAKMRLGELGGGKKHVSTKTTRSKPKKKKKKRSREITHAGSGGVGNRISVPADDEDEEEGGSENDDDDDDDDDDGDDIGGTKTYGESDLAGMAVSHSASDFAAGTTSILTLADRNVLNDDGDDGDDGDATTNAVLVNSDLVEASKSNDNLKRKRAADLGMGRAGGYAGFDDDEFEELGGIRPSTLRTAKGDGDGDADADGRSGATNIGFRIGDKTLGAWTSKQGKKPDLFASETGAAVSLITEASIEAGRRHQSDFLTAEEMEAEEEKDEHAKAEEAATDTKADRKREKEARKREKKMFKKLKKREKKERRKNTRTRRRGGNDDYGNDDNDHNDNEDDETDSGNDAREKGMGKGNGQEDATNRDGKDWNGRGGGGGGTSLVDDLEATAPVDDEPGRGNAKKRRRRDRGDDGDDDDEENDDDGNNKSGSKAATLMAGATATLVGATEENRPLLNKDDSGNGGGGGGSGGGGLNNKGGEWGNANENIGDQDEDAIELRRRREKYERAMSKGEARTRAVFGSRDAAKAKPNKEEEEAKREEGKNTAIDLDNLGKNDDNDDDDDAFLRAALAKARRLKRLKELAAAAASSSSSSSNAVGSGGGAVAGAKGADAVALAVRNIAHRGEGDDNMNSLSSSSLLSPLSSGKVTFEFDETREFTRALRARESQVGRGIRANLAAAAGKARGVEVTSSSSSYSSSRLAKQRKAADDAEKASNVDGGANDVNADVDMAEIADAMKDHDDEEEGGGGGGRRRGGIADNNNNNNNNDHNDDEEAFGSTASNSGVGRGLSAALSMLRRTGEITGKNAGREELRGRAKDERTYEDYDPLDLASVVKIDVAGGGGGGAAAAAAMGPRAKDLELANREITLEYRDDHGRLLTRKEAYRNLCYQFHGHGSSKKNEERRLRQIARERAEAKAAAEAGRGRGGTLGVLKATQRATGKAFVVHKT